MGILESLLREPPIRQIVKLAVRYLRTSEATRDQWNAANRPQYLAGVLYAAREALKQGLERISVIEFGVADGYGLIALQEHARRVSGELGVSIEVIGFDSGLGLPRGTADHRDHCDVWMSGDYQMDVESLIARLDPRTRLVLGEIADTVSIVEVRSPIGFIGIDLDFYSSTVSALRILLRRDVPRLLRVPLYFDDVSAHYNHAGAGELLAIREFNEASRSIRIDRWRGIRTGRAFPEAEWLDRMYMAHDLGAIDRIQLDRDPARMR